MKNIDNYPEIMTIEEVAEYLRTSTRTIANWANEGKFPAGKLGNVWRIHREDLRRWVEEQFRKFGTRFADHPVNPKDIICREQIKCFGRITKKELLNQLVDLIGNSELITDVEDLRQAIFQRESLMSTGIGLGIGIPHVRLPSVRDITMAVGVCPEGVDDYESLDDEPVKLVFLIAARNDQHSAYLKLISRLSRNLKDPGIRNRLLEAKNEDEIYNTFMNLDL